MLFSTGFTIGQKLRWISLLLRTGHDKRFHRTVKTIFGLLDSERPVVVDVGANVGNFVKACADQTPKPCLIIAIEPSAYVFGILSFWARIWGRHGTTIRCHKTALGHQDGMVDLNTPIKKSGSFRVGLASLGTFDDVPVHAETVAMTSLDALLARDGTGMVDLIKVDVEGAEALVLSGADHLFGVVRPVWYMELDERRAGMFGGTAHDIFDRFIKGGYDAYILDDQARLTRVTAMTAASDYLFMPVARP